MKSYTHLIYREFKVNKKRYIYTVIGIIIGIILFTSVNSVGSFLEKVEIESAKAEIGNYEVRFNDVTLDNIEDIKANVEIESCGIVALKEIEKLREDNIEKKIYTYAFDNVSLNNIFKNSIKLKEGRLPQNNNEIIIDLRGESQLHKKLGDSIKVEDSTYKIVGFYTGRERALQNIVGITKFEKEDKYKNIYALSNFKGDKHKIDNINKVIEDIGINATEDSGKVQFNGSLLYAYNNIYDIYGNLNQRVVGFVSITLGILILTIILINSSINTSVKERIKCFSILRCIGASESKIKFLILKESLLLALISIIPGIILGYLVSLFVVDVVLIKIVNMNIYGVNFNMDLRIIFYSVILTFITVILSSFVPIINASKTPPIYGVKSNGILKNRVKRKKSNLIRKLFGYKTELAYKNVLGDSYNFKKGLVVLSSIFLIFTIVTGLYLSQIDIIKNKEEVSNKDFNIYIPTPESTIAEDNNASVNIIDNDYKRLESTKKILEKTGGIKNLSSYMTLNISPIFKGVETLVPFNNERKIFYNGEKYTYIPNSNLIIYDDNAFKEIEKYIKGNDISLKSFKDNGAVIINETLKSGFFENKKQEIFNGNNSGEINFYIDNVGYMLMDNKMNSMEKIVSRKEPINIRVIGTIDRENVLEANNIGRGIGAKIIVSRSFYEKNKEALFSGDRAVSSTSTIGFDFVNSKEEKKDIEYIKSYVDKIGGWYLDNYEEIVSKERTLKGFSIIIYILLSLIGSIGVINMINNKNINILLRKKEFRVMLAIGMKKSVLRKIIILEGVIQWIIASLIGGILSYISLTLIYKLTSYFNEISKMTTPIWIVILGILGIGIISVGSSIVTSRKVNKMEGTSLLENEE